MTNQSENEEWRDIEGWEGYYQVSSQGRVRSLDRTIPHARYGTVRRKGRVIVPGSSPNGYVIYGLRRNGRVKGKMGHSLVLEAFVGPRPHEMQACHSDGNPKNNRVENLRWDTDSANKVDIQKHGRNYNMNKTECPRGHPLAGDNLKLGKTAKGTVSRHCKACNRARAITTYDKSLKPHLDAISDLYFERVTSKETLTRVEIRRLLGLW